MSVDQNNSRPCRACGIEITFLETPDGKFLPAHRVRTVYERYGDKLAKVDRTLSGEPPLYVSHFETCPDANQFSGGKKA